MSNTHTKFPNPQLPSVSYMRFFTLTGFLLLTFTVARADWVPPKPGAYEQEIARLVADILPKWHYDHEALDDDKSAAAFGLRRYPAKMAL